MSTQQVVDETVSARLVPRGWTHDADGWWQRAADGWTGLEVETKPLRGWLADDAPPGSVYLAVHAGVGLDRLAPIALAPWSPDDRPSHGQLWPFRGTETRVFDPATGLVHATGVVAGDDWTRGTPLADVIDELAEWAEPLTDERTLRDHLRGHVRRDPGGDRAPARRGRHVRRTVPALARVRRPGRRLLEAVARAVGVDRHVGVARRST